MIFTSVIPAYAEQGKQGDELAGSLNVKSVSLPEETEVLETDKDATYGLTKPYFPYVESLLYWGYKKFQYLNANVGAMAIVNNGMSPTFNFNIGYGRQLSSIFGVRCSVGGFQQSIRKQVNGFEKKNKFFLGANVDLTVSIRRLWEFTYEAPRWDYYFFIGPGAYFSKGVAINLHRNTVVESGANTSLAFTTGCGASYLVAQKLAISAEYRYSLGHSIYCRASGNHENESVMSLNVGVIYYIFPIGIR